MARLVHEEGMHLDVATGGELYVALAAGVPPDRLVMHGNNKSLNELRSARQAGVGRIVVDSFDELERLAQRHAEDGKIGRASWRERGWQYVWISGVTVKIKKKKR